MDDSRAQKSMLLLSQHFWYCVHNSAECALSKKVAAARDGEKVQRGYVGKIRGFLAGTRPISVPA